MRLVTDSFFGWLSTLEDQSSIVRCVVCSTLVVTVTWLAALGAVRRSAAIRHRLFSLGFAGLLAVPVAIAATAGWNPMISFSVKSDLPRAIDTEQRYAATTDFVDPALTDSESPMVTPVASQPLPQDISADSTHLPSREPGLSDSPRAASDPGHVIQFKSLITEARTLFAKPLFLISAVWAAGVLLLGMKLALEWFLIRSIVRNGVPITDERTVSLLQESRRATQRLANHRTSREPIPQLICSSSISVPIAAGILVPKIILPAGFGKWTSEQLRIVLIHELTHIDRHDVVANLLARLACVLYWFNPLVWLAARRMCLERELACDDFLLCLGESADRYANDLIEIAAALKQRLRTAQLAIPMAAQSSLRIRVQQLMKANLDRRSVSNRTSLLTAAVASVTVMSLAAVSPSIGVAQTNQVGKIAKLDDTSVTLSGDIPRDWFEQLNAMPNLKKLTIRNPALENLKVAQLRELKNLTEFSAEDFSIDSRLADIVAVNIAQLPNLVSVQFHRTGLTQRGLQSLSQSPATELILDGEELLTDADFKHVAMMPSLRSLVLDTMPIEVDGLKALQAAPHLRRLVLRRHPAGSYQKSSEERVKAIVDFKSLESLELGDTGYSSLVPLKTNKSLKLLTLRNCGAFEASKSLKQLTQLKRVEFDSCDIRNETFDDVKASLQEAGIVLVDVTQPADVPTQDSAAPDDATKVARHALEGLDVGQHFPAFWIRSHHHWSKIPSMTAEPARTVHRLKQALIAEQIRQPWEQDTTFAYAPGQFFMRSPSTVKDASAWQQITYGDAKLARSREGSADKPPIYVVRSGVQEFEQSLGLHFPRQLSITHQHLWWGVPTHHNITQSPVSPQKVAYVELAEETFADEPCRVLQAPGRSERLWVSKTTGRLRGALHYIHQGYFTPFYKQDVVTKIVGRRIESNDEYAKLFSGPRALPKEAQNQLSQAWAEHKFSHAYPSTLFVLDDYREIAAGHWFPFKVKSSGWHHNDKNEGKYDFIASESTVTEIALDRNDLEPYWSEFLPKAGENIQDQRYSVAVNYTFRDDQNEDEIQTLINQQLLEQARTSLVIDNLSGPFAKMVGKPAPSLSGGEWVGERVDLKGKRYLIHFWATWCGPCKNDVPLLNSIAKNRIVIGVHPGDTKIEQMSEAVKDSKMAYPTIVAPPGADDLLGYPAKMFPYCVEVDEHGRVAKQGFLEEVLGVKPRNNVAVNPSSDASGTVLAIDEKNGLAVISLGEADGIQDKQQLDVMRDGKSISQLRVVTLQKDRCVGKTTVHTESTTMKTGDKVTPFAASK